MKIYLFGIGGVYNYGCEAIVRGTELIIHNRFPNAKIIYMSFLPDDDKRRLRDINIEVKPIKKSIFKKIYNGVLSRINLPYRFQIADYSTRWIKDSDIILSIGGDVYNLPSSGKGYYYNRKIKIGEKIRKKGKKLIIWGLSAGPFESNLWVKARFMNHIKNDVNFVTVRENNTIKMFEENHISNIRLYSDPAFAIDSPTKNNFNEKPVIGINLSPLSLKYCMNGIDKDKIINKQAKLIEKIIKDYDADIVLIPHVICNFKINDDDFRYLLQIYNTIQEGKERVKIIDTDPGFIGIKEEIVKCDMVLAVRMHCAINAVSCAVPTVFIGYSDKASGMCRYVYDDLKYFITLTDFSEDYSIISDVLENKEKINTYLKSRITEIRQKAYDSAEIFEEGIL